MTVGCSFTNADVNLPFWFAFCRESGKPNVTEHCRRVILLHSILKEEKWIMLRLYNCRHIFPQINSVWLVVKRTQASFQGGRSRTKHVVTEIHSYPLLFKRNIYAHILATITDLAINKPIQSRFLLTVQVHHILQNISPSAYAFWHFKNMKWLVSALY